ADPERPRLLERHLETYMLFAEKSEVLLAGPGVHEAHREMNEEQENLLAALAWRGNDPHGVERGLRLAAASARLWSVTSQFALGLRVASESLARDTEHK